MRRGNENDSSSPCLSVGYRIGFCSIRSQGSATERPELKVQEQRAGLKKRREAGGRAYRFEIRLGGVHVESGVAKTSRRKKTAAIVIRKDLCKGCGICVAFCPKNVLELGEDEKAAALRIEECTACGLCEMRCPDLAIELRAEGEKSAEQEPEQRV